MSKAATKSEIVALAELARQVRHCTLDLLEVPAPAWLTWTPAGTANHILWHAGHALWVNDALTVRPLTAKRELPPGWAAKFGQNSRPATVTDWPNAADVRMQLERQLDRIMELFEADADTIIENASATPSGAGWPLLPGIIHGWHDEARHQGEMYLLHKMLRARK